MCRLCAMTASLPKLHKRLLFDLTLMMNNADKVPQRDGWGVTDGENWFKGPGSYRESDPTEWMKELDDTLPWMGHLRNASSGTSLTTEASHPYEFPSFIGMHNGNFIGTTGFVPSGEKNVINTDSWRMFYRLQTLLDGGKTLNKAIVEDWLSGVEQGSAFVCMIMHNSQLHIIRGPNTRDMYYFRWGNGFFFNTDDQVLKHLAERMKVYFAEEPSELYEMPEFTYAVVQPGTSKFEVFEKFDYKPIVPAPTQHSNVQRGNNAYSRQSEGGQWYRITTAEQVSPEETALLEEWVLLKQRFYPVRKYALLEFISRLTERSEIATSYKDFTSEQLALVNEATKGFSLTDEVRENIHYWNLRVGNMEDEVTIFRSMEPEGYLWTVENLRKIADDVKTIKREA